jgi:hypothetical protein
VFSSDVLHAIKVNPIPSIAKAMFASTKSHTAVTGTLVMIFLTLLWTKRLFVGTVCTARGVANNVLIAIS